MRIHRNIETLQDEERLTAWVYQIARNVIVDHHRRASNSTLLLPDAETLREETDDEPEFLKGDITWLDDMIRSLPSGYREAVQLAEIEELSQQVVADRFGLSLSGAKSRIQRGRAMLKDVLEEYCSFELDGRERVMTCDPKPNQKQCQDCEK